MTPIHPSTVRRRVPRGMTLRVTDRHAPSVYAQELVGCAFLRTLLGLLSLLAIGGYALAAGDKAVRPAQVEVDTSAAPDLADWGAKAKKLVMDWHPRVAGMLPSEGFKPRRAVRLVFKKDLRVPAYASGGTITISADWVRKHPDDFGMVIHELTHVIQDYGRAKGPRPGWLVEGIADYVRFFHYEPNVKIRINPQKASYRDSYRTTAKFLAWVEKQHDKELVRKLNAALRRGEYRDELFQQYTTRTLDQLWANFIAAVERKAAA
jgi:hypothetical protein